VACAAAACSLAAIWAWTLPFACRAAIQCSFLVAAFLVGGRLQRRQAAGHVGQLRLPPGQQRGLALGRRASDGQLRPTLGQGSAASS